jgi:N-acetyl-gamma-glutamyl-phosphate/LysW-gamma-L-alpha-aminoadipyl-6-phosphate reductase
MSKLKVSIAGGSGYTGGEVARLLLFHPNVEFKQITSERFAGKFIHKAHPNLRKITELKFNTLAELAPCDVLFLCLPHGKSMHSMREFKKLAGKIIDLSGDFRLNDKDEYAKWYGAPHVLPESLTEFIYGIPELHREEMRYANYVSSAGCNATAAILGLYPLFKHKLIEPDKTVVEVKGGSSEGGNSPSESSHHPERNDSVRSYKPTGHRHQAEVLQELSFGDKIQVHMSMTALGIVRGALATAHVFLKDTSLQEKDIWKIYRQEYGDEPFIRIVKETTGTYRLPEPKLLIGSNYCDVGFQKDEDSNRLVVISAIDNLMKGAGGQAVQAFNIMNGFPETTALEFPGLHPV